MTLNISNITASGNFEQQTLSLKLCFNLPCLFYFILYLLCVILRYICILYDNVNNFVISVYACVLFLNIWASLAYFIADSNGGATFGMSIVWFVLFTPCSFICWYRPLYKAFRYVKCIYHKSRFHKFGIESKMWLI